MKMNLFGTEQLSQRCFESNFLNEKFNDFKETINRDDIGFFHVSENTQLIDECKNVVNKFQSKSTFVHVGIGGSSLGPEMLISALKKNDKNFVFINNIDPNEIHNQLSHLDLKDCVFYFCSKSGGTAETMASLSIISSLLNKEGISTNELKDHIVFATDPSKSDLLELGRELSITCLTVPTNIGGRFTVLTPVGYLPALFSGIDIEKLAKGAEKMKPTLLNDSLEENQLLKLCSFLFALREEHQISQTVFMPYSSQLRNLSHWFVQLWAESLGKELDLNGKKVNTGFTPVAAYGATDQHSQVQLFMEGPYDKSMLIIEVENFDHDYSLGNEFSQPAFRKLAPYSLSQLMKAELNGTLKALEEKQRPHAHIAIDRVDEEALGGLILFFESLTALMGCYLNINPFDQPGVEAGKKYAFQWLD